jgi:SOUL heme-binding protein
VACSGPTPVLHLRMGIKEPSYRVELQEGAFELRHYQPRVVAETHVNGTFDEAGSSGFRRLAGYIFGGNQDRQKIAMTAPVGERPSGRKLAMTAPVGERAEQAGWLVTFTMPAGETLATLPAPNDAAVTLRELPAVRVAVHRSRGRWTDAKFSEQTAALRTWASARGLRVAGEPEVNRYDPPWTPWFMRRNEVWMPLAEEPGQSS